MHDGSTVLSQLGWSDRWQTLLAELADAQLRPGRVVRQDRGTVVVATDGGEVTVGTATHPGVVTGDWVAVSGDTLAAVLPRQGCIRRRSPEGFEQLLAANVDVMLLMCGLDRPVKAGRIERGAVQAWDGGAVPVVVLTKCDLHPDPHALADPLRQRVPGLEVVPTSSRSGAGIEELRALLLGKTAVMIGESGAGKSSLLNLLAGTSLAVGDVRPGDAKGRHTTTRRELHIVVGTGVVIDTPGLRAFALAADSDAIDGAFADIGELAGACRFRDCGHDREPGCAVRLAMDEGRLHPQRLASYQSLQHELVIEALRGNPHEQRRFQRKFARQAQTGQRHKQEGPSPP